MKKEFIAGLALLLAFSLACSPSVRSGPKGHLFIVGGGDRDEP